MRQCNNLSLYIPTLKGLSIPMPQIPFPYAQCNQRIFCVLSISYLIMLKLSSTRRTAYCICHLANLTQPVASALYTPPSVVISIKGKSLPYTPPTPRKQVSTREIVTNGARPWKPYCRVVARATSTACQLFQSSFFTLQVLNQK